MNPLDADRAYGYLVELCNLGPRPSGSAAMTNQQKLLREFFTGQGGKVSMQRFHADNPLGGDQVAMANMLVEWHPDRKDRILLCGHYDTRPIPGFVGANDGASGVAVLMELSHLMAEIDGFVGVDFLLVDGEELVYTEHKDPYFLGSTHFAQRHRRRPPIYKYRWGVLLDMVGGVNLTILQERFGTMWRDTKPLVKSIWATAARLGVKEFVSRVGSTVSDDHLPLHNIGRIPTCDIIDFEYPQWHTVEDDPAHCSGESLAKVGWVVFEWLKSEAHS
jgi:hypothetical protein